jgi:glycosyltransferase involved in cell wall biosynthesis
MGFAGPATSDLRLARLFTRRSLTEPRKASSVGILSTYPPTQCGIATFSASLTAALSAGTPSLSVGIVRVGQAADPSPPDPQVVFELTEDVVSGGRAAAEALNKFDIAIIQHEYGIYSGPDGDQVLDVLEALRVPILLVVHTVLSEPTAHQRFVLEMLTQSADAVVTMSESGRRRLLDDYRVEPSKIMLIPHGAPVADEPAHVTVPGRRPTVLTWGLLGPGKGIEWGIDALSAMGLMRPRPRYLIAGQTHPKVLARQGESYRESLKHRAQERGVGHLVEFEPGFVTPARLRELLREADVVLLPYDSHEQITSGVLTEAMASMVPVVSTAFPHAVELLSDGRGGTLVPHQEPDAIAAALTRIIVEPGVAAAMSAHNASLTRQMSWPVVAGRYRQLLDTLMRSPSAPRR